MTKELSFSTIGTFGDTIYSLCVVKMLGGGDFYVKINAIDDFVKNVLHWAPGGPHSGRYTQRDYDVMLPLLEAQDYLHSVHQWNGEHIDYQLENHYQHWVPRGWQGNQTECYALLGGFNIHDPAIRKQVWYEHWLTPVTPIHIPGKPIVVNRTSRYLLDGPSEAWSDWVNNGLGDYAVFVGNEEEHADFEKIFKLKIEHYKTNDLLELAQVIQGCDMFIGNQSVAFSIAVGLGKPFRCEIRKGFADTKTPHGGYGEAWFPRINGSYFSKS